jgi:cobalt-zinc-cadmium efflux system protein
MHEHDHHGHAHAHAHAPSSQHGRAFAFGIALNVGFIALETTYGLIAHSTALLADATHNLSDVLGLGLAWAASVLARRRATVRRTYGLRGSTVLAALANALLLLVTVGGVAFEALGQLRSPAPVQGATVMAVAGIGVLINGAAAVPFLRGSAHDQNLRGAFLHLAADAAISLGVLISGAVVLTTGLTWVDPAVCLVISGIVLYGTFGLLRDSLHLALHGVPERVDIEGVAEYLTRLPEVKEVHDLHVWAMSTTETALTAHLVMNWPAAAPAFLGALEHELKARFGIDHTTVQIDPSDGHACSFVAEGSLCAVRRE